MSQIDEQAPDARHQKLDKRSATTGFGWSLLFNIVNKFFLPLAGVIIARTLGPAVMGAFAILYAIYMASEVFRDAGLSQTYMRDQAMDAQKEGTYMLLGLLQGLVPAAILFAFRHPISSYYNSPEIAAYMGWVCLGLVINGFGTIPRAKVLRAGMVKESGFREMVANSVALALAICLVLLGYGYEALVTQMVANCTLNVGISYGLAPVKHFGFHGATMLSTLRSSASTLGANLLFNAYTLADSFVIGRMAGTPALGLYSQGKNLALKPMQLLSVPMMRPLQVAFSQSSADRERLADILARSLSGALLFVAPCYALMVVASEPVVMLLLGSQFADSVALAQITCLYFGSRTIGTISGTALVAGGKARLTIWSWIASYATAIALIINAGGNLQRLAWAFAIGALVAYVCHTVFALTSFRPAHERRARLRKSALVSGLSMSLILAMMLLPLDSWVRLLLATSVGGSTHLALVGVVFASSWREYYSVPGVKKLFASL